MINKIYEVTISLDDYNDLKNTEFMFNDIIEEFKTIILNARLNYCKDDLNFDGEFKPILKKYCGCLYKNRISELKEGSEDLSTK